MKKKIAASYFHSESTMYMYINFQQLIGFSSNNCNKTDLQTTGSKPMSKGSLQNQVQEHCQQHYHFKRCGVLPPAAFNLDKLESAPGNKEKRQFL
jgi:hypothetical protein